MIKSQYALKVPHVFLDSLPNNEKPCGGDRFLCLDEWYDMGRGISYYPAQPYRSIGQPHGAS